MIGETVGKLHKNYTSQVEHETKLFGALLEPIMIIILGVFVGFIRIAMY